MSKGKIVVFSGSGKPLEIKEYSLPSLRSGEVLVKNRYTTLCGSDIHTFCGIRKEACPTVLGHEVVGEIVSIANDHPHKDHNGEPIAPGNLITWSLFSSDPQSVLSKEGIPQKGDGLFKYGHALLTDEDPFHGGMAEYCVLRTNTAILKIPDSLPLPVAATLNCAISTVAGALRIAGEIKGKNIMIFGLGMLGICCATMCRDAGANWIGATDVEDKRLKDALLFGADAVIKINNDAYSAKAIEQFVHQSDKKSVDIVFDMSGVAEAMEMGLDILGIGGTAVWIGAVFNNRKLQIDPEKIVRNLHTIRGLHNYNFSDFKYALHFLKENWKKYPFDTVVEKEFDLEHARQAFEYAINNKPLRVGIRI